jgi:hypothetical protein
MHLLETVEPTPARPGQAWCAFLPSRPRRRQHPQQDANNPIDNQTPAVEKATMNRTARQTMAWKIDGTHVYPVNDLREHSVTNCWCEPVDDDGIMVHNSLDGRELYERGERQIS